MLISALRTNERKRGGVPPPYRKNQACQVFKMGKILYKHSNSFSYLRMKFPQTSSYYSLAGINPSLGCK